MYILFEATQTTQESIALYHNYSSVNELLGDFEHKLGTAMKDKNTKAEALIAFDHTGKIYAQGSDIKEGGLLSPRLIWVTSTANGEGDPDQSKKDSIRLLEADYHIKKGAFLKDNSINGALLLGFDGNGIAFEDYVVKH